jgi:type II secretory pathway pseudopilin PulG
MTLLEIMIAVALISVAAASLLPALTYGFVSLVNSQKITQDNFNAQTSMEQQIVLKQDIDPTDVNTTRTITVFGTAVKGHVLKIVSYGADLNVFLPKRPFTNTVPILLAPSVTTVRKNTIAVSPQPGTIDALDSTLDIFASDVYITTATQQYFLLNTFRWYISDEMDSSATPSSITKDYFAIKEWNEAKPLLPYSQSNDLSFIPNIKIDYNRFSIKELTDNLGLSQTDIINRFGNRYVRYGVTPYSVIGRIGKEELSVPIYLSAPRISIVSATFVKAKNMINIKFADVITTTVSIPQIFMNDVLGTPSNAYRSSTDSTILVLEFDHNITQTQTVAGNRINVGAVASATYGNITVWSDNVPGGTFTVLPAP